MEEGRLEEIWNELVGDYEFFAEYREKFRENFVKFLGEERPRLLSIQGLNTLVERLYLLMFSFQKNPRDELFNLSYMLARYELNLKKVLNKACLVLARDYIDYLVAKDGGYERIKLLLELIEFYLSVVEDAYSKYVGEIEEELKREERKAEESGRRIALSFLEELKAKGKGSVELLTYYKEVPVVCRSEILQLMEDSLRIRACNINVFNIGDEVYIKHQNLPKPIAVKVRDRDTQREELTLEVIGFADLPQDRRKFVRVVPREPIPIELRRGEWETVGTMADISVGGVGVYVKDRDELKEEDIVEVSFTLPKGEVKTVASVRYILPHENIYRIGLHYRLDIPTEEIVSDYVMERQFEILRELKGLKES